MTKEKYILWSGWALMGGALIFTLAAIVGNFETSYSDPLGGRDGLIEYTQLGGMIISHLLFVFGIVGLHLGYGSRVSSLTRASLVLGVMCAAIALLGGSLLNVIKNDSWAWPAWFFGFTVMLLSLIPLGVDSVRRDLMPRRNWSALLAGLGLPLFVLIQITIEAIVGSQPLNGDWIFPLVTAISMGGLFVLGLALHSAQPGLSPDPSSA